MCFWRPTKLRVALAVAFPISMRIAHKKDEKSSFESTSNGIEKQHSFMTTLRQFSKEYIELPQLRYTFPLKNGILYVLIESEDVRPAQYLIGLSGIKFEFC